MSRFDVTTVRGFRISDPYAKRSGLRQKLGCSAHVIGREWNCRVVATYRSEDRLPLGNRRTRGTTGARRAARDHARYLNELYG